MNESIEQQKTTTAVDDGLSEAEIVRVRDSNNEFFKTCKTNRLDNREIVNKRIHEHVI